MSVNNDSSNISSNPPSVSLTPILHPTPEPTESIGKEILESISKPSEAQPLNKEVKIIQKSLLGTLQQKQDAARQFKVGDVVFIKDKGVLPSITSIGQKISQLVFGKPESENYRMEHVAIVVDVNLEKGRVIVVDTTYCGDRNEVHKTNLFNYIFSSSQEIQILRTEDNSLAEKAAEIAKSMSDNPALKHSFSIVKAVESVFRNTAPKEKLTPGEHKRIWKRIADQAIRSDDPQAPAQATGKKMKDKSLFCSHLIAHTFQQAELGKELPQYLKLLKSHHPELIEELDAIKAMPSGKEKQGRLYDWARRAASTPGGREVALYAASRLFFRIDPKKTSPATFIEELTQQSKFTHVLSLTH